MGRKIVERHPELREAPRAVQELQESIGTSDSGESVSGVDKGAIGKRFEHDALRDKVADLERGTAPGLDTPGLPSTNLSELDVTKGLGNIANPSVRRSVEGLLGGRAPSISEALKGLGAGSHVGPSKTETLSQTGEASKGPVCDEEWAKKKKREKEEESETGPIGYESDDEEDEEQETGPVGYESDDEEDEEDEEEHTNPDENYGPPPERVTWEYRPRGAGSRATRAPGGHAPIDPVNPEWGGESGGGGGVIVGDGGVVDPLEEDAPVPGHVWNRFVSVGGVDTGRPAGPPQGGGPIDPVDPEVAEDPPGSGPLNPDYAGGGTTDPQNRDSEGSGVRSPSASPTRSGFRRAAGFLARTAVTVGVTIGVMHLSGALADRNEPAHSGRSDAPAVSESDPRAPAGQETDAVSGREAGASGVIVEGSGSDAPSATQTRAAPASSGRSPFRDNESGKSAQRFPNEGPSRGDGGSSGPVLERDSQRQPESGSGSEPEYEPESEPQPGSAEGTPGAEGLGQVDPR